MEDRDNSVINALKRLDRAGSEHSKTTQKLIEAADRLAEHIEAALGDVVGPEAAELPRYYFIGRDALRLGDAYAEKYWLRHGYMTRQFALHFAHDIATGWLDELAEWVEKQDEGNAEAVATLHRAAQGMAAKELTWNEAKQGYARALLESLQGGDGTLEAQP